MITPTWTYSNIQCFVNNTKCCQAQMTLDYTDKLKSQGVTDCMKAEAMDLLFMNYQIQVLSRYAPEGSVLQAEVPASFTWAFTAVLSGRTLQISVDGTLITTVTVQLADTTITFATAVAAAINTTTATTGLTAESSNTSVTIYAPDGEGYDYNGIEVSLAPSGSGLTFTSFQDPFIFLGGIDQVLAGEPCLTETQARTIYETLDDTCGGGCGCSDDNIYIDSIIN